MSSEAQNVIAEVMKQNLVPWVLGFAAGISDDEINQDWVTHWVGEFCADTAEAVDEALGGLRRETRVIESIFELGVPEPATRFVTHWMEIPHE
ncbi:hypothetical protein I5H93_gp082 [Mycobacterium phage SuperGrey]|uniref:Uncharacterized protein n=1 Tax=Mycobacterium phage SuperGrey TaxID=1913038 RepID=A0A1J0GPR8_9CAUD|nr:hypothetical protein I5H93_gp082 [Mycobacterium phage SuperGrey]APC43574.1 hypothetical protein SEA_SUPERGREY_82 [Mycobacterium phage SuperGrey]